MILSTTVVAVLASSGLFMIVHDKATWGMILLLGIVLAELYRRTGSLWAAMAFHACHNCLTVAWLLLNERA